MSSTRRPEVPLQVITPADSRASVRRARRHLENAVRELASQAELESWVTLGYPSWSAMVAAEYGPLVAMVPSPRKVATLKPADVANEGDPHRPCGECGRGMSGRADRRFCSSACRQKAYRAKS